LLRVNNKLDYGSDLLGDSVKEIIQISETDKKTMGMLKTQTDILHSATGKLNEADGFIDRSEKLVRNMLKRVFTNKLVLFAIIILLVLLNTFILYVKIKYKLLGYK
jgi:vesicle transport through interaction with t-SNAREs protein 1